jgi:hypothetical protein
MKLTNTQWIIVAVVGAVAIWYFFLRKKDETKESGFHYGNCDQTDCDTFCGGVGWGDCSSNACGCNRTELVKKRTTKTMSVL